MGGFKRFSQKDAERAVEYARKQHGISLALEAVCLLANVTRRIMEAGSKKDPKWTFEHALATALDLADLVARDKELLKRREAHASAVGKMFSERSVLARRKTRCAPKRLHGTGVSLPARSTRKTRVERSGQFGFRL